MLQMDVYVTEMKKKFITETKSYGTYDFFGKLMKGTEMQENCGLSTCKCHVFANP